MIYINTIFCSLHQKWLALRMPTFHNTEHAIFAPAGHKIAWLGRLLPIWFEFFPALISNYIHYKMWAIINYPFPNVNVTADDVWESISSNIIPPFFWTRDFLSMLG